MFIIQNRCQVLCTAAAQQPFLKVRQRKEVILVYEGLFVPTRALLWCHCVLYSKILGASHN